MVSMGCLPAWIKVYVWNSPPYTLTGSCTYVHCSSQSSDPQDLDSLEAAVNSIRTQAINGRGTEISTSVLQYSFADLEPTLPDSSGALTLSPCQVTIDASMAFNAKKISFVLTAYAVWANSTLQR